MVHIIQTQPVLFQCSIYKDYIVAVYYYSLWKTIGGAISRALAIGWIIEKSHPDEFQAIDYAVQRTALIGIIGARLSSWIIEDKCQFSLKSIIRPGFYSQGGLGLVLLTIGIVNFLLPEYKWIIGLNYGYIVLDAFAITMLNNQFIGCLGCFSYGCCVGIAADNTCLKSLITVEYQSNYFRCVELDSENKHKKVVAAQIYQAICGLLGLIMLFIFFYYNEIYIVGSIFGFSFLWLQICRYALIERIRAHKHPNVDIANDQNDSETMEIHHTNSSMELSNSSDDQISSSVQIPVQRVTKSHRQMRAAIFIKGGVYIPKGSRCCAHHLFKKSLTFEAYQQISGPISDVITYTSSDVLQLLHDFRRVSAVMQKNAFDFDDPSSLSDTAYYNLTGLKKNRLNPQDIMIVDRGFRDAVKVMENLGFEVMMPEFLNGKKQFTTYQANSSRCGTKIRWAVESVNAMIKRWKFLSQTIQNSTTPYLGELVLIVCALINCYQSRAAKNLADFSNAGERMLDMLHKENNLEKRIDRMDLRKPSKWRDTDADKVDFPQLSEDDIRELALGEFTLPHEVYSL
ncbi:unnamed protein product, partial [Didymodactylos carnosus]